MLYIVEFIMMDVINSFNVGLWGLYYWFIFFFFTLFFVIFFIFGYVRFFYFVCVGFDYTIGFGRWNVKGYDRNRGFKWFLYFYFFYEGSMFWGVKGFRMRRCGVELELVFSLE